MPINSLDLGVYNYIVRGTKFDVPKQYAVQERVGQGAYGFVCAAQDSEKRELVAIKKIEYVFERITFARRALRELKILRHLKHDNLIDIRNVFVVGPKDTFEDIYVVSELMETDLASILRSQQPLSDDHSQFFLYQILRGMKYMHSAEVIHRDLKPMNLLVNSNCDLKICDFGIAKVKFLAEGFACDMTEYVCTRWYRAPEVLCSWADYGKPVDIWSAGCIFAEMLKRKPLFPGHNTQHQLHLIISFLGTPGKDVLRRIPIDNCRKFIESLVTSRGRPLEDFVPTSGEALVFLTKTLRFNPDMRVTVEQALQIPYLAQLHCPEDEPSRGPLEIGDFEFERRKIDMNALRQEIFLEALRYYPVKRVQYVEEQTSNGKMFNISEYRLLEPDEWQYTSEEESDGEGGYANT